MKKYLILSILLLFGFINNTYAATDIISTQVGDFIIQHNVDPNGEDFQNIVNLTNLINSGANLDQIHQALVVETQAWNQTELGQTEEHHSDVALSGNTIAQTCNNGLFIYIIDTVVKSQPSSTAPINNNQSTPPPTPPAPSVPLPTPAPEPTPEPVITTSNSTQNSCSSYISSWSTTWSNCSVNGAWSSNGTIQCSQTASHSPNYSSCGSQVCTTTYSDGVATGTSCGPCTGCPGNAPAPTVSSATKTISLNLSSPISQSNNAYANNFDKNIIRVGISGNTNQNRNIVFGSQGVFSDFVDLSNIPSNKISNTGEALNINYSKSVSTFSPNSTLLDIEVASRTPLLISGAQIGFKAGSTQMVLNNVSYNFKKPFTGFIETWDNVNENWNGAPVLGTQGKYRLLLEQKSNLTWNGLQNYTLNDFSSKVEATNSDLEIQGTTLSGSTLTSKQGTVFTTRINTSETATTLPSPEFQINLAEVYYTLGGQTVGYYLSDRDDGNDNTPIKTSGSELGGVLILGTLQGGGKSEFTGQESNISDLSTSQLRNDIRRNAYSYIRNMSSGDILDGVKYIEGDYEIESNPSYNTLVVKDGNVIIGTDLNPSNKVFGIIVLKDNYDVSTGYNNGGNIYVKPSVTEINAFIYSDGALVSVDNNADVFPTDSIQRTNQLRNQLIMNGSLFSRNTIGGAILAGGDYLLPGGSKTSNFDLAMQYDLNYVRRGNLGCDKNSNGVCTDIGEYVNGFVIKYDPRIQVTPPKLFSN